MLGEEFLEAAWPDQPFVAHDLGESVQALRGLSFLSSLEAMLTNWPNLVQVHLPDVADESSAIAANTKDAGKLLRKSDGAALQQCSNSVSGFARVARCSCR